MKIELTYSQADKIRYWRCDVGFSWRRVAEVVYEYYPELRDVVKDGNQISGRDLCDSAQTFFNGHNERGWN